MVLYLLFLSVKRILSGYKFIIKGGLARMVKNGVVL